MNTKKLCTLGILSGISLIIFVLELRLPTLIPIPGIKPGLSNIIVLVTLYRYDRRSAGAVLLVKTLLGAVFAGSVTRLLYALSGSVLCFAAACALWQRIPLDRLWFLSAVCALMHNLGQLLTARVVTGTPGIFWYAPALAISGVVTGVFTGFCALLVLNRLGKVKK